MDSRFRIESHPQAPQRSMVHGKDWRITILAEKLVRLEYSPSGKFEDGPTQVVWNRDFPVVPYDVVKQGNGVVIRTSRLCITYDGMPFSPNGLAVTLHGYDCAHTGGWHYGDRLATLKGTARTLDTVDGDDVELEDGIISTEGFSVIDDSHSYVIGEDGWLRARENGVRDLYFFGYGKDYKEALRDFNHLCGKTPMLPRYALGNWWSRFYPYSEESYLALMDRFAEEDVPIAVAVVDMDWHLVAIEEKYGSGWTGFTWNRRLFPDPERFLSELHRRGMHVTLNLHPADGIRAYEDAYVRLAHDMGMDIAKGDPVAFDACDPVFLENYFKDVIHPLEDEGVDFWWLDWQQGDKSRLKGLDTLWVINHYSYLDNARSGKRPLLLSRYAGPGSHRYPAGFSGDTIVTWASLRFQPYFTATASNIGFGWWSHDIGGHMRGCRDDELIARWTQLGVFSPIMRLHSACGDFFGKEPWRYKPEACRVMESALRLRHRLVPYLYTMNHRAWAEDLPIVLPLYYEFPNRREGYSHPDEFFFGTSLLVAPITSPRIARLNVASEPVFLPEGLWYDIFTHRQYRGGRELCVYRTLESVPVFAKAGTILPLTDENDAGRNPESLTLQVFLGSDGSFTLYEDDGGSMDYQKEVCVFTEFTLRTGEATTLTIHAARGERNLIPQERRYRVEFIGCRECGAEVCAGGVPSVHGASYSADGKVLTLEAGPASTAEDVVITLPGDAFLPGNDVVGDTFRLLDQAEISFDLKEQVYGLVRGEGDRAVALATLASMDLPEGLLGALAEILTAFTEA